MTAAVLDRPASTNAAHRTIGALWRANPELVARRPRLRAVDFSSSKLDEEIEDARREHARMVGIEHLARVRLLEELVAVHCTVARGRRLDVVEDVLREAAHDFDVVARVLRRAADELAAEVCG